MEFLSLDTLSILTLSLSLYKIGNALLVVLGLGMVIFFHELGHFAVAKWCDVHVERFSIGIGPIIWSRQKGETEYALSALPFGGYVKMLGQDDMDPSQMTADEIAENPRSYSSKKVWQRMAIISAGVIMNVITGFMFFAIAYKFGVVENVPMVGAVAAGSPAWNAGMQDGDIIEEIDGEQIQNAMDINQAVVLSDSSVTVKGVSQDGTPFERTLEPELTKVVRTIGIGYASTSKISTLHPDDMFLTYPGLPADKASEPFLRGDRIVAVNGRPISYLHEMSYFTARDAAIDVVYDIERPVADKDGRIIDESNTKTVSITVPPKQMKSVGMWMAIGPVSAVRENSIADKAGMKLNDLIIKVDGLEVSEAIDPLRLPNYFAEQAGQEIVVTVRRQTDDDGREDIDLSMTPDDIAGWSDRPESLKAPLLISSIGAGFHVQPRIAKVLEGSEAANPEMRFAEGQKIIKVELVYPDATNISEDALGDEASWAIDIAAAEADKEVPGEPNWAYVFWKLQMVPNRHIKIHVAESATDQEAFASTLKERDTVEGWYLPLRGITGWEMYSRVRTAESWGEASSLGYRATKNSGISIYMTLRSLFTGNLSVRALSGPLGIVTMGYMVADDGMTRLLKFLGYLSINLAVLNFLPIPVLDGGHMVFLIWEGVARKKPSPKIINLAHGVGLIFIISLFVFVMYQDIFVNGFGFGG